MNTSSASRVGLAALVLLAGVTSPPAQAQKMYRCGNVYQDQPCSGGQQGRVVSSTGTSQPAAASSAVDSYCAQRGENAQKIMWAKEAGRTEEMQLSAASNSEERRLIGEVYRKRGSSVQVRVAIEADCMAERQRAEQAAALVEAAARLQGLNAPAPAPAPAAREDADADAAARQQKKMADRAATEKKARCDRIAAQMELIRRLQRAGGSVETMNGLRQRNSDADKEWSDAGC